VSVAVRNDGDMAAEEVVQCYVGAPGVEAEQPVKLLRAFDRVALAPGETGIVQLFVSLESLCWRDPATHGWKLEGGSYRVLVGGASDQLIETRVTL